MKRSVAIAALLLSVSTALPAMAASPHDSTSIQQRQAAGHRLNAHNYRNSYDAYAAQVGTPVVNRQRNAGHGCVERTDSGAYSAFPSWDVCN